MRLRVSALIVLCAVLAGCAQIEGLDGADPRPEPRPEQAAVSVPELAAPPPPPAARTVEEFDTTTAEQRAEAAVTPAVATEEALGVTVASLGDPTEAGFWVRTPLVSETRQGRIVYPQTGQSAKVELQPLDADPGAGSQVSLAAFRLIGAPLTGLPEIEVFAQ